VWDFGHTKQAAKATVEETEIDFVATLATMATTAAAAAATAAPAPPPPQDPKLLTKQYNLSHLRIHGMLFAQVSGPFSARFGLFLARIVPL
jgi:H+/gluconate symporter-like permease